MKKICVMMVIAAFFVTGLSYAGEKKDSGDLLKEGLLGAGAGVAGGFASGGKGRDVWKGALAGAGVNIIGGAIMDSFSGEKVESVQHVDSMGAQDAYKNGYNDGFNNGYKQGYTQGYKEAVEALKKQ